jgi:hypothetical protein
VFIFVNFEAFSKKNKKFRGIFKGYIFYSLPKLKTDFNRPNCNCAPPQDFYGTTIEMRSNAITDVYGLDSKQKDGTSFLLMLPTLIGGPLLSFVRVTVSPLFATSLLVARCFSENFAQNFAQSTFCQIRCLPV